MNEQESTKKEERRSRLLDRIFPLEHDFEGMLYEQAQETLVGVDALIIWIEAGCPGSPDRVHEVERRVDRMRYELEETLVDAFSTPFDRQDLYSLSRQMDYILNYASTTAREMHAFGVAPDEAIERMARLLLEGTRAVVESMRVLTTDGGQVRSYIRTARAAMHGIEDAYIEGLVRVFREDDPKEALRKREIYHHLRDGGRALRGTVDVLHRVVVGLS
ncbi:hypothetical protein DSECCO2_476310 [anaerobic digester metagenome]